MAVRLPVATWARGRSSLLRPMNSGRHHPLRSAAPSTPRRSQKSARSRTRALQSNSRLCNSGLSNQSPRSNVAMYDLARELIVRYRRNETESARILFLANAAAFDALIGCFDAKYHYWMIRPPQADPGITLPIGLPPHPSYPSAHSCISGAITATLANEFPSERARLEGVALEASLSRLYAGIHYRFDMRAGLALGAAVAGKAAHADLSAIGPH